MARKSRKADLARADGAHISDHDAPMSIRSWKGRARCRAESKLSSDLKASEALLWPVKRCRNHGLALKGGAEASPGRGFEGFGGGHARVQATALRQGEGREIICDDQEKYRGGVFHATSGYKAAAPVYVVPGPENRRPRPRLLHHDHIVYRGCSNDTFGRAHVPIQYPEQYDENPSGFRAKTENGQVVVTEEDFPLSISLDNIGYRPENPTNGLELGLGSSSRGRAKRSKPSKAVNRKVEKVTPRIVSSVAVGRDGDVQDDEEETPRARSERAEKNDSDQFLKEKIHQSAGSKKAGA
ncbi:hypothetical protein NMY22_g15628 [Coprinellus aureogranulatus]|nr:hypothetical protein NMY22_g15628 [Coprinellus aureogranulatus]